jgi:hypothetical protein
MGERRKTYIILKENLLGKQPLGRLRRRWKDNMNMNLKKYVVRTGGGWKWFRKMFSSRFWY